MCPLFLSNQSVSYDVTVGQWRETQGHRFRRTFYFAPRQRANIFQRVLTPEPKKEGGGKKKKLRKTIDPVFEIIGSAGFSLLLPHALFFDKNLCSKGRPDGKRLSAVRAGMKRCLLAQKKVFRLSISLAF
ncbi:hypothetical protein TNCV_4241491 [Trichonephila clavipes]|nr:hypothetical protein TNCV_4241491 [Trichonephila clavipes]